MKMCASHFSHWALFNAMAEAGRRRRKERGGNKEKTCSCIFFFLFLSPPNKHLIVFTTQFPNKYPSIPHCVSPPKQQKKVNEPPSISGKKDLGGKASSFKPKLNEYKKHFL